MVFIILFDQLLKSALPSVIVRKWLTGRNEMSYSKRGSSVPRKPITVPSTVADVLSHQKTHFLLRHLLPLWLHMRQKVLKLCGSSEVEI